MLLNLYFVRRTICNKYNGLLFDYKMKPGKKRIKDEKSILSKDKLSEVQYAFIYSMLANNNFNYGYPFVFALCDVLQQRSYSELKLIIDSFNKKAA